MGCDDNGDGCSSAELLLDEIARGDRSVDARWPSRETVRLPNCQTMQPPGRGFARCPSCVTSDKPGQSGKGSIKRRSRHGRARAYQSRSDQTRSRRSNPEPAGRLWHGSGCHMHSGKTGLPRSFDCPADRLSLRRALLPIRCRASKEQSPHSMRA